MKVNKKIDFNYSDFDKPTATCIITYNNVSFVGEAQCHPDDMDFASERTGLCIAEARANIKLMTYVRDTTIKPALAVLRHLQGNMESSKHYNPKSYEAKMVRSQIRQLEKDLATANNDIAEEKKYLKEYIQKKDEFYKKMRAKRQ